MRRPESRSRLAPPERDTASGAAIALGAIVSVAMMSHHPSIRAHGTEDMFAEAVRLAAATKFVHAAMIVATVGLVFGFSGFSQRLGLGGPLVRLGLVSYAFGGLALAGAAILNGLVFPEVAGRFAESSVEEMETARTVLVWNWEVNQALALVGVLAWSLAVTAWSLALVRLAGAWRWIGGLGLFIGVVGAFVFLSGRLAFDVHGFGLFVLAQAVWNVAVGMKLALPRGR